MNIIDTHSHIYAEEFDNDIELVIKRAKEVGVERILLPNVDVESIDRVHHLSDTFPNYCIPMMGLHPTSVGEEWETDLAIMHPLFEERKYIAVGEIGIDLYWDKTFAKEQAMAFEEQLRWSIELGLPVAIHSRNSTKECIEGILNIGVDKLRGVFHSFSTTLEDLENILTLKTFKLGINGVVTFKNSDLSEVLKHTDLSNVIIETDAPYLTPAPFRGKRNESAYTQYIVEKLSNIFGVSPEEVGRITSQNAEDLFRISKFITSS